MQPNDTHQIIYMSHAVRPYDNAELAEMLGEFRDFNNREQITGLLIYSHQKFMQVIEGPEGPLHALYGRIPGDPRHYLVLTMLDHPIRRREFADWTMGYPLDFGVDPASIPGYNDLLLQPDVPDEELAGLALGMLQRFRDQMRQKDAPPP